MLQLTEPSTFASADELANGAWSLVTRLGEAQILLPIMLAATLWIVLVARSRAAALWWLAATAGAALVTTATKVAFIGYGIGYAPLDYTGISGHAMFAAAILPILAGLSVGPATAVTRRRGVVAAYALAALIAWSRVVVRAHSPFEAALGFALGGAASGLVLWRHALPALRPPRWFVVAGVVWLLCLPWNAPPSMTHDWVTRLSLTLSDRPRPYTRWQMHRDWRRAAAPVSAQRSAADQSWLGLR